MKTRPPAVSLARDFAIAAHKNLYGGEPYVVHLDEVDAILVGYGHGSFDLRQAAYLHDVLEDCSEVTPQKLLDAGFSPQVVEIVRFCTDEPGANRKERKAKTYERVRNALLNPTPTLIQAAGVKLADRLANIRASARSPSAPGLFEMYWKEYRTFRQVYETLGQHGEMWLEYGRLLGYLMA